ncbi:hypothetical protein Pan97_29150 [Bremerella volcania]|uniref:Carboxypeptidase regulatory-like domain-containing protein n=1 Tax=Bremerella volcania TaxID=2527984 RepID=A0A518C9G4_9BACT|nr:hypothetical protein [Bremerella volcania]QDU75873.1 hypothetical protein Pan97_29150 [Bremerella volcania]
MGLHVKMGIALLVVCGTVGCGNDSDIPLLVPVSGKVTVDGTPIAGLQVSFEPIEGRRSTGVTDHNGQYALAYLKDYPGAVLGDHQVRIAWTGETTDEDENGDASDAMEMPLAAPVVVVPPQYNVKTQLRATVTEDSKQFDFEITTGRKG